MTYARSDFQLQSMMLGLATAIVCLPFSVRFCHIGLLVVIVSWMIDGQWLKKWNFIRSNIIVVSFIIFFVLNVLGLLYTNDPSNSWFNIEKKIAWIALPIILASTQRMEKKNIEWLFSLFIAACFIGSLICIAKAILMNLSSELPADTISSPLYQVLNPKSSNTWMFFSYTGLASGIDIHPTYFSLYLLFCLLLLFKLYQKKNSEWRSFKKIGIIFLAAYITLFIICLSSRITTLALLVLVFVSVYLYLKHYGIPKRLLLSFFASLLFCLFIFINPVSRYRNFQEPLYMSYPSQNSNETLSISIRASLWWLGIKSAKDVNLMWGAGPGDVKHVIRNAGKKYSISNSLGSNDPHNQFLQTILALGLIGLFSLLCCLFIPAYMAFRSKDFFYLAFLGLFAFVGLTETVLEMQKGIVFFSIFNSLLIFQYADWSIPEKKTIKYA